MIRVLSLCAVVLAMPAFADEAREADCGYQGHVVSAVQAARVADVAEAGVVEHLAAAASDWPEKYNAVVPLVTPWVYSLEMAEVTTEDLGAAWAELCLAQ